MVAIEPVIPIAWAKALNKHNTPIYLVAVAMGSANCRALEDALLALREVAEPVDIFGEPEALKSGGLKLIAEYVKVDKSV